MSIVNVTMLSIVHTVAHYIPCPMITLTWYIHHTSKSFAQSPKEERRARFEHVVCHDDLTGAGNDQGIPLKRVTIPSKGVGVPLGLTELIRSCRNIKPRQ